MGLLDALGKLLTGNNQILQLLFMMVQQSGGLENLLSKLQRNPSTRQAVDSWVTTGPNQQVSTTDLAQALGPDNLSKMSSKTGMNEQDLLGMLAQHLPQFIDQLTPDGKVNHNTHTMVDQAQEQLNIPRL